MTARCGCGFAAGMLPLGGGMANFESFCAFPALCDDCRRMDAVNLLAERPRCGGCGSEKVTPYDHRQLKRKDGPNVVAEWNMERQLGRRLLLTDGEYFCPACRKLTMAFYDGGLMWD